MPFTELRRWVKEEATRFGLKCSTRQAHSVARAVWAQNVEQDDREAGLYDLNLHSDPTAREAIRRVMAEQLGTRS